MKHVAYDANIFIELDKCGAFDLFSAAWRLLKDDARIYMLSSVDDELVRLSQKARAFVTDAITYSDAEREGAAYQQLFVYLRDHRHVTSGTGQKRKYHADFDLAHWFLATAANVAARAVEAPGSSDEVVLVTSDQGLKQGIKNYAREKRLQGQLERGRVVEPFTFFLPLAGSPWLNVDQRKGIVAGLGKVLGHMLEHQQHAGDPAHVAAVLADWCKEIGSAAVDSCSPTAAGAVEPRTLELAEGYTRGTVRLSIGDAEAYPKLANMRPVLDGLKCLLQGEQDAATRDFLEHCIQQPVLASKLTPHEALHVSALRGRLVLDFYQRKVEAALRRFQLGEAVAALESVLVAKGADVAVADASRLFCVLAWLRLAGGQAVEARTIVNALRKYHAAWTPPAALDFLGLACDALEGKATAVPDPGRFDERVLDMAATFKATGSDACIPLLSWLLLHREGAAAGVRARVLESLRACHAQLGVEVPADVQRAARRADPAWKVDDHTGQKWTRFVKEPVALASVPEILGTLTVLDARAGDGRVDLLCWLDKASSRVVFSVPAGEVAERLLGAGTFVFKGGTGRVIDRRRPRNVVMAREFRFIIEMAELQPADVETTPRSIAIDLPRT